MGRIGTLLVAAMGLLALVTLAFRLGVLQRYEVREQLAGVTAFWHEGEAFVFVDQNGQGHRRNALVEYLPDLVRAALLGSGLEEWSHLGHGTKAYRLAGSLIQEQSLAGTPLFPSWDLEDGKLNARPSVGQPGRGFRWTGSTFERVEGAGAAGSPDGEGEGEADDEADDEGLGRIAPTAKAKLKAAGWHFRVFTGYEAIREPVELTIDLGSGSGSYGLLLQAIRPAERPAGMGLLPERFSVSLSGKGGPPPAQTLFDGGAWRQVSREEYTRLMATAPQPQGRAVAAGVAGDLLLVAAAALGLWLMWKGPTRGVKIALVVLVLAWIAPSVASAGWRSGLSMAVVPPAFGILAMVASTRLVKYRARRTLVPVGEDACPAFALAQVRELTAEFEALGFRFHADRQSTWQMMSQTRRTFIRFFSHGSGHVWAEVHASDEPKLVGRMLAGVKGETMVSTNDLQSNHELLRDPKTLAQRVPRKTSCADMMMAHDAFAMKAAGPARNVDDPVAADVETYDRWVSALVRSKQVSSDGEWFKISPRAAVPITLRVMAAWFH